jgi:hypothetical protein
MKLTESCRTCDFSKRVREKQGEDFVPTTSLIRRSHSAVRLE